MSATLTARINRVLGYSPDQRQDNPQALIEAAATSWVERAEKQVTARANAQLDEAGLERAYVVAKRKLGTRRSETVKAIVAAYLGVSDV